MRLSSQDSSSAPLALVDILTVRKRSGSIIEGKETRSGGETVEWGYQNPLGAQNVAL
jgi:hypothetical protein